MTRGFGIRALLAVIAAVLSAVPLQVHAEQQVTLRVGGKNFTEQEILGEIVAQLIERDPRFHVERSFGLGGTGVVHGALLRGEIDLYVEYTGTALLNMLKREPMTDPEAVYDVVSEAYERRWDLEWLPPIGFNNTYAITVRSQDAEKRNWATISDLAEDADDLTAGFTGEFLERPDGYPGLRQAYGIRFGHAADVDSGLMYKAVANGQVDVVCGYSTDARIVTYDLKMLRDNQHFFPPYDAAPVVRGDLLRAHPEIRKLLAPLAGTIDDETMRRLNHAVDELGQSPQTVAAVWISGESAREGVVGTWSFLMQRRGMLWRKVAEHLTLTGLAMLIAIGVGVPAGVLIHRYRAGSGLVLAVTEIVQTIPSLAMLAFLFAVYGLLGMAPAVTALVLYALLPIVLNTFTALKEVSADVLEAADGVGMSRRQRLYLVELPLALPVIIAGIRTSTVWTVGIATLSTYIGAGGLGDFIARGLARNDPRLTLLGAAPAALIAVMLSLLIRTMERRFSVGK